MQRGLFGESELSVDTLLSKPEDQWFDRKSFRIEARALADAMIGFANADGGQIVVGIHSGQIEGIASSPEHLNALRQAAIDYSTPPVRHKASLLACRDRNGQDNHLLLIDIEASEHIHCNRKQECFLRVGDENRRLGRNEERELAFDKGEAVFDQTVVKDLSRDDLDLKAIGAYAEKMGVSDITGLMQSRGLYLNSPRREGVTQAGWLLFGNQPPIWSYIRYLRYSGTTKETGIRSNLIDDIRMQGTIPSLIEQAIGVLKEKMGTAIRLAPSGRFERMPALPEFAWLEAIVNAVTHRSYSIQGDGIRVTEFDDRLEVESPGRLPGLVRIENIRNSRFSRNPHIARVLAEATGYVRELNEGVKRMFEEMERSGLPYPHYSVSDLGVKVTLFKQPQNMAKDGAGLPEQLDVLEKRIGAERLIRLLITFVSRSEIATREIAEELGVSVPTARSYLGLLAKAGLVSQRARTPRDPKGHWVVNDPERWTALAHHLKGAGQR